MGYLEKVTEIENMTGTIDRILFSSSEEGSFYRVLVIDTDKGGFVAFGQIPNAYIGAEVQFSGKVEMKEKYGKQLHLTAYEIIRPSGTEGIQKYLSSGLISGIRDAYAKKIVNKFGEDTLRILDEEPERLLEVYGIGKKRYESIMKSWSENKTLNDVIIFLGSIQLTISQAMRIVKKYKENAVQVIKDNPYCLSDEIEGISFPRADKVALALGVDPDDPMRIRAAIMYVLKQSSSVRGHSYLTESGLLWEIRKMNITINVEKMKMIINSGILIHDLIVDGDKIYLRENYNAERMVAFNIARRITQPGAAHDVDFETIEGLTGVKYDQSQKDAMTMAVNSSIMVMTGGPGTGKTVTIGGIIGLLTSYGCKIQLAAPTGRAAKRMTEATGMEAKTIHRLLEFNGHFQRNGENPLECDALILDECSMIDLLLMDALLDALPLSATLIMVGDVDQLPSVGVGNVLHDIIECGLVPVARLQYVHRQGKKSLITENAHNVNEGKGLMVHNHLGDDFFFSNKETNEEAVARLVDTVRYGLQKMSGISSDYVQVLSPQKKGDLGTIALNKVLQEVLNPGQPEKNELKDGDRILREGDRIMQIRNNYDKEVFNGDIGIITAVDPDFKIVTVNFDGYPCDYDESELSQLLHAYAITVHKSQGSEYPAVVMPMTRSFSIMRKRKLFYTAITRAKKAFVLIGDKPSIAYAIQNNEEDRRNSDLQNRIRREVGGLQCST